MTTTIEQLQKIVADESRTEEERKEAAQLILKQTTPGEPAPAVDPALQERRSHFTVAQRRLADNLHNKGTHLINQGRTNVQPLSDKLVTMQIVRLMLDDDGSDGVLHSVYGWNSKSTQSLADRIGDHPTMFECNPQWRFGMQPAEKRIAYAKKMSESLKLPFVESQPELTLDAKSLVRLSADKFAEFVVDFYRQVLNWDLKAYIYANLKTPGTVFFDGFLQLQRDADTAEESLFKNAMAAHMLAFAPDAVEDDAQDFLETLAAMAERQRLEEARRLERIAKQKPRSARTVIPTEVVPELTVKTTVLAPASQPEPDPEPTHAIPDVSLEDINAYYAKKIAQARAGTAISGDL